MTATLLQPIVNAGLSYVNLGALAYASATTLTVAAGQWRDSTNVLDIITTASVTINAAVNGANGLDTGSFAASTWYYVFMIADSRGYKLPAGLISTSATAPVLPVGYDSLRRIGSALSDGSTHFLKFNKYGTFVQWDTMISVLSAGTATSFTAVDLSAAVPPLQATQVRLDAVYTPATAGNAAQFRPTGSTATTVPKITGVVATQPQDLIFSQGCLIASSKAEIDYLVANGSDALTLYVIGYDDYV